MPSVVYWIHLPEHTDMFTQGYIGVTKNVKKRFTDHKNRPNNMHLKRAIKKYGWDNLVKSIVLMASETYCLAMEVKIRATEKIGWNVAAGGSKPPMNLWNKGIPCSKETKNKISATKTGHRHSPEVEAKVSQNLIVHGEATRFKKGQTPWNKGLKMKKGIKLCQA